MKEIWKPIAGYEGLYEVSNLGRVKSLERKVKNTHKSYRTIKEKIISLNIKKNGYIECQLYRNQKAKHCYVHRLVAVAFIKNPKGKNFVNHKNGIKGENNALNLEWCTAKENLRHALKTGLRKVKLSDKKALEIYALYERGVKLSDICEKYKIHNSIVSKIAQGKCYQHLNLIPLRRLKRKNKNG